MMAALMGSFKSCSDLKMLPAAMTARVCLSFLMEFCTKTCGEILETPCKSKTGPMPVISASYHAHLLGREMYQQVFPKDGGPAVDLGSQPAWHYDDQAAQPLAVKNITIEHGDTIQATCVFDSTGRTANTVFGRETVDEMCFNGVQTEHLTASMTRVKGSATSGSSFKCKGPMWTGILAEGEDGTKIVELHPASAALKVISPLMMGPILLDGTIAIETETNTTESIPAPDPIITTAGSACVASGQLFTAVVSSIGALCAIMT